MILVEGRTINACSEEVPAGAPGPAVRLARESDRPLAQIARDLGVHKEALRTWVRQDEADRGERDDRLSTIERDELVRLRQEVRDLRRANEILREASVLFAKELDRPRTR